MICWNCYWGWPKPVADIYRNALNALKGNEHPLLFGPAHIVWEDENFDSAKWCLDNFDDYTDGFTKKEMEIVKQSLIGLENIPLEVRCPEPEDYDGENPGLYPPPKELVMVKEAR